MFKDAMHKVAWLSNSAVVPDLLYIVKNKSDYALQ